MAKTKKTVPKTGHEKGKKFTLTFDEQFGTYLRSGFPLMSVRTEEVERCIEHLQVLTKRINESLVDLDLDESKKYLRDNGFQFYTWDVVNGIVQSGGAKGNTSESIIKALRWMMGDDAMPGVYVFINPHLHLQPEFGKVLQMFRMFSEHGRMNNKHIVLVGEFTELAPELNPYVIPLDFKLPTKEEIREFVADYIDRVGLEFSEKEIANAASAATGMTLSEVESAVCVALVASDGETIPNDIIFDEKAKAVMRSQLLEHIRTDSDMGVVGGLSNLKEWFSHMASVFHEPDRAAAYKLPALKGCMIVGVHGTGKTLAAKAVAKEFGVPLFRLDVGRLFGGIVGETESKVRQFFKLAEAVAPAVILIDECEKAFSKSETSTDGGVTERLVGNFLYWMQEKTAPIYLVATANNVERLDPAMMRKGRWDEMFFVDLPTPTEREEIFKIHLRKVGRSPADFQPAKIKALSGAPSDKFTGAEIENCVHQAMIHAFHSKREFTINDIAAAVESTIPLAKMMPKPVEFIREWGQKNARPAGEVIEKKAKTTGSSNPIFWKKG